jgi:hypothetical protein
MTTAEDIRDDWLVLRRNFADTISPTTMNAAEGFERLTRAIWRFLDLETAPEKDTFYTVIDHKIDEVSKFRYRVTIKYPSTVKIASEEVWKMLVDLNKGPFHTSLEQALEYTFNGISRAFQRDLVLYKEEVDRQEVALHRSREVLQDISNNISYMGKFELSQPNLPMIEKDPLDEPPI